MLKRKARESVQLLERKGIELFKFQCSQLQSTTRTMKRSKIFGLVFLSSCIVFSNGKSLLLIFHVKARYDATGLDRDPATLRLNFRSIELNWCLKKHRVTLLGLVRVLTFSRLHFALPMESPDREKPLKLVTNTNSKYLLSNSWQPEPQV